MHVYNKKIDHPKQTINEMINICGNFMNNLNMAQSMTTLDMCKDVSYGFTHVGTSYEGFGDEELVRNFNTIINNHNQIEYIRSNNIQFDDDFIQYAKLKAAL
jgi:hypothetical protein